MRLIILLVAVGQLLDQPSLSKPSADSWPTYHGDYSGRRHSALTQVAPDNVGRLALAWAFQTGQPQQIKATPILVNGILYVTTPDNLWALDARSARQVWHYTYPANQGFHIGHRGPAIYKDSVFLTTPDAHLVLILGGDSGHLHQGREAVRCALDDKTLRPHYAVIEARRLAKRFLDRAADPAAASALVKEDKVVMSGGEKEGLARRDVKT